MSRTSSLTAEAVYGLCNELAEQGKTPSVRLLQSQLGGSTAIITEHLREWRQKRQSAPSSDIDMPATIKTAIAEYVTKEIRDATARFKEELEAREEDFTALAEDAKRKEDAIAIVEGDRTILVRTLEVVEVENKFLKERIQALEEKISSLHEEKLTAEKKASFAEGQLVSLKQKEN